jgi:NAD-dependent deacetylase
MDDVSQIAAWLAGATRTVVFTGAGISTESGIPDFRSPQGIWSRTQPVYFEEFLRSASARQEYWRQKSIAHRDFAGAQPNEGHRVLAAWESAGRLSGVITQNIDGLHQAAGSRCVLELHGTAREVSCLRCARRWPADPWVQKFLATNVAPDCPECGGPLKHATISFGQALDEAVLEQALAQARDCELFLALGSSLVVQPAAGLPALARQHGARLVIINREPTPLDGVADLTIHESIGQTLTQVAARVTKRA